MKNNIVSQYKVISDDMRFYGDQRFKIITVFLVTNGFMLNFIKDKDNIFVGLFGAFLAVMCLFWDIRTKIWWGTLIERAKEIEKNTDNGFTQVYLKYKHQYKEYLKKQDENNSRCFDKIACLNPSKIIVLIYIVSFLLWIGYVFYAIIIGFLCLLN